MAWGKDEGSVGSDSDYLLGYLENISFLEKRIN